MKTLFSFFVFAVLASSCSEEEISPETNASKMAADEQPPKSDCTGLPNCH